METTAIQALNNVPTGTFIAIALFLIGILVSIGVSIYKVSRRFESKIRENVQDDIEHTHLVDTVDKLASSINKMDENLQNMNASIQVIDVKATDTKDETQKFRNELVDLINKTDLKVDETQKIIEKEIIPHVTTLDESVKKVTDSNLGAIKSYIINEYQKWMAKGYIDVYSLSMIEDRYRDYAKSGGNTFIRDLMEQLRQLEIKPMVIDKKTGMDPVKYFNNPDNRTHLPDNCSFYDQDNSEQQN